MSDEKKGADIVLPITGKPVEAPPPPKPIQVKGFQLPPPIQGGEKATSKEKDVLLLEIDHAVPGVPSWVKYMMFCLVGTIVLASPAALITIAYERTSYWGQNPENLLIGGAFSGSVLLALLYSVNLAALSFLAFIPFVVRHLESLTGARWLGARSRAALKHCLMIRWSIARLAAIVPAWLMAQWYLVLPAWAPQFFTATLVFAALFCLKDIIIQQVAINYHSTYHEERIATNKLALKCMKLLRNHYLPHHRSHNLTRSDSPDSLLGEESVEEFQLDGRSITSAKIEELSGLLFKEIAEEVRKEELKPEDLYPVLGKPDADAFFKYLDADGNGDLTRKEFVTGIIMVYQDRDNLAKTLAQSDDVITRLNSFVAYGAMAISGIICLSVFNISGVVFGILSANFAFFFHFFFNDMFTEAFNSIVFVFVTHPFDTGDQVQINGKTFWVRKIGLWYTSFYGQGKRLVYRRNAELCSTIIVNVRRSGPMTEEFLTTLDAGTTAKQLLALEERMSKFMKANPRDYEGITYFKNIKLANSEAITVSMEYRHKSNFSDNAVRNRRNVIFMNFFKQSLDLLGIQLAPYSYDLPFTPIT